MYFASYPVREKEFTKKQLVYLISGYIAGILNDVEIVILERWLLQSMQNQLLFAEILLPYNIRYTLRRM
jgi:hypothetical protein